MYYNKAALWLLSMLAGLVYLFIYVPVFVLIAFSFNENIFAHHWTNFTLSWYSDLCNSSEVWFALKNSLIVATLATLCSLGMTALFVFFSASRYINQCILLFYAALTIPEVVVAVALLTFFSWIQVPLGLFTLVAGHTLLALGYVIPIVHTRYQEIDIRLVEAARDLGATPWQTFYTIIVPLLSPAFMAAGLLVFVISLDDFIISFFCMSGSVQTLPLYIFAMIRAGATPMINALSVMLLVTSIILVCIFFILQDKARKLTDYDA